MPSILFVSIAFPPKSDAEGLQVAKYAKYLLRNTKGRFDFDVVTSSWPTLNMNYDEGLEYIGKDVRQLIEVPVYENRYTNFLLRTLSSGVLPCPDSKFSFYWQWRKVTQQLHKQPSLIYSRSFPVSSALMALKLKNFYKVPWVMHLSDLWADCPEMNYKGKVKKFHEQAEKACFDAADVVCVTSRKTLKFYQNKYPHLLAKLAFFPNVYDSELAFVGVTAQKKNAADRPPYRIVHTGSLAGDRTAAGFLKALSCLPSNLADKFEVIFAGQADHFNRQLFSRSGLKSVRYIGPVPYTEAIDLQQSADMLLLIDMPVEDPSRRVFFPSKLLDYLMAGKPILGLTDSSSEVETVLNEISGNSFDRHDYQGIAKYLAGSIMSDKTVVDSIKTLPKIYDAEYNVARLIDIFESLSERAFSTVAN